MAEIIMNIEEEIKKVIDEQLEATDTIINFYGCSFNFANDGYAEARYYMGDEIYNQRKE